MTVENTIVDVPQDDKLAELRAKMQNAKNAVTESKENNMISIVAEKNRSYNLGIVASGQAGGKLAQTWFQLGYKAICFNTAPQDLEAVQIPESNKYLFTGFMQGCAKELALGSAAAEAHKEKIFEMVTEKLADADILVFTTSLGGGSGAGSVDVFLDVLSAVGKPVVVLTVLPMNSDDSQTKKNALETLAKLSKEVANKRICNLVVIDNAKIESLYSNVNQLDFFRISNQVIVEPLDIFNTLSTEKSSVKPLDGAEFGKLLTDGGGISVYGQLTINDWDSDETAIANAIVSNLTNGLLATGFDISQAKYVGYMICAPRRIWEKIPSVSINYASTMLDELCGGTIFKGIFEVESKEDEVKIYSFFSGLGLPQSRVEQLQKETSEYLKRMKVKEESRNLHLQINTGDEVLSSADKIRQQIATKKSAFGSLMGKGKK